MSASLDTELDSIFERLRATLGRYSPPLAERPGGTPNKRNYHLWSEVDVEIAGRRRSEVYFAGLIIQKGYVGFHYMPIYTDSGIAEVLSPRLLQYLRGKSCFHIKALDDDLLLQIEEALRVGFALYTEHGWV